MAASADPFLKAFGRRVQRLREDAHLTQEELGARARLSPNFLSTIERGTKEASLTTLRKLAAGLRTTPAVLLMDGGKDDVDRQVLAELAKCTKEERLAVLRSIRAFFAK